MKKRNMKVVLTLSLVLVLATVAFAKNPVAIVTPDAPAAIGPYSQGIKYGELVFISGQLPLDPVTGVLESTSTTAATVRVMENLEAILAAAGLTFDNVLMTTVYLASTASSTEFNNAYGNYFGEHKPARATIVAGSIPRGALLEVSMIAGK